MAGSRPNGGVAGGGPHLKGSVSPRGYTDEDAIVGIHRTASIPGVNLLGKPYGGTEAGPPKIRDVLGQLRSLRRPRTGTPPAPGARCSRIENLATLAAQRPPGR